MKFDVSGWLDDADKIQSPNRYTTANAREIIVMHYTAGYNAASAINTFKRASAEASAHFVVAVDGSITQMVSTNEVAWHAGFGVYDGRPKVNSFSIGIEIDNPGYHFKRADGGFDNWERKPVTAASLAPFPGMVEARDAWVGSAMAYWPKYPEAQLKALESLTKALLKTYKSITDIVGHKDVDSVRKRKVDPGPAFPMQRFNLLIDTRSDEEPVATEFLVKSDTGTLNVRGGPGTNFDPLSWGPLSNGQKVIRLEGRGEWYRVRRWIEGTAREGWVYAPYLVPA